MKIRTMAEANQHLEQYISVLRKLVGGEIKLDRMWPLLEVLGNPHEKLRIIHIAGTSGKTSTAYYIAQLLTLAGCKVGLTVSPHVDSVAERVQINLEPLSETEFCSALSEFLEIIEPHDFLPTYFELMVAFAYWYFAKAQVDYAVIETGIGGMHDSTNAARKADKFCVITDIGYDHMDLLGNTLPEIAKQKAGIMHRGNNAIMFQQSSEIMQVMHRHAETYGAALHVIDSQLLPDPITAEMISDLPLFQQRNWLLAYHAYIALAERDSLAVLDADKLQLAAHIYIPARMNIVTVGNKTVVLDGAHNPQKIETMVQSYRAQFSNTPATVILALKANKNYHEIIAALQPITDTMILTAFDPQQALPSKNIDTHLLEQAARAASIANVQIIENEPQAFKAALDAPAPIIIITGSLYLVSQLRLLVPELRHR